MEKKRKWEKEYEEYSNSTELDERIELLEDLINKKTATKNDLDTYKKITAIKANLPKVKNILELRGKLEEQVKEMKAEIAKRELAVKNDKTIATLEDEMKKLEEEQSRIEKEIKDPNLTSEKKAELKTKLAENMNKRQENNRKFGDLQEEKQKNSKDAEQSKFKDISTEDLKNEMLSTSTNISKCNLACNKLMQGFSWKSIEVALDKFENERLTAKGAQARKMQQNKAAAKAKEQPMQQAAQKEEQQPVQQPTQQPVQQPVQVAKSEPEKEEKALAKITGWQKIKNGAKAFWKKIDEFLFEEVEEEPKKGEKSGSESKATVWQKIKGWFKKEEQKEEQQEEQQEKQPIQKQEEKQPEKQPEQQPEKQSQQDKFREQLRFVAENGINVDPAEKAREDEINKTVQRIIEAKKIQAMKNGEKITAKELRAIQKTARAVAENRYKINNKTTVENEGPEL